MSALAAHERSPFWLRARAVWANDASTATRARNGRLFEEHDVVYRRWWAERENNRAARDENSRAFLTLDAGHTALNQLPVGDFKVCMHCCVCHRHEMHEGPIARTARNAPMTTGALFAWRSS